MQSFDFNLIITNGSEHTRASCSIINSSEIHRVTLTNVSWIRNNLFVLINDTMRQRLGLGFDKTLPPQMLVPEAASIISSRGPYRTCEHVYLSSDFTHEIASIAYPALVPDLPVDFVLGTLYFRDLTLKWSSSLNRVITYREEQEIREDKARRETYKNIL